MPFLSRSVQQEVDPVFLDGLADLVEAADERWSRRRVFLVSRRDPTKHLVAAKPDRVDLVADRLRELSRSDDREANRAPILEPLTDPGAQQEDEPGDDAAGQHRVRREVDAERLPDHPDDRE